MRPRSQLMLANSFVTQGVRKHGKVKKNEGKKLSRNVGKNEIL